MQASGQDRIAGLWPSALQSSEEARRNAINGLLDDNIGLLGVPLQMTGSAAVPQAGSAAVFKTRSVVATIVHYLGHESVWRCRADDRWRHYAHCGQNCGCCRAANDEDWPSGCAHCVDLWYLSIVNQGIRRTVAWQTWQSYCHADWWCWWWWYNQGDAGTAGRRLRRERWVMEVGRRWEAALTASRQWAVDETMDGFAEVGDEGMEVD